MTLRHNIHNKRKSLNMTLESLAKIVGTSKQTIQRYESGVIGNIPSDKIEKMADAFGCTPADLMGWNIPRNAIPVGQMHSVPVLGTIAAGFDRSAVQDIIGYEMTDHLNYQDCFFLKVTGNSMEPRIFEGDFVLIDKEATIDNGNIVAVIVDGEEGTVKKYEKKDNAIVLKPLNPACETRVFVSEEQKNVYMVGRVVEVKAKL